MWAASRAARKMISLLLNNSANIDVSNQKSQTALIQDNTFGMVWRESLWRAVEQFDENKVKTLCNKIRSQAELVIPNYSILQLAVLLYDAGDVVNESHEPVSMSDVDNDELEGWRAYEQFDRLTPISIAASVNNDVSHHILSYLLKLAQFTYRGGMNIWQYEPGHTLKSDKLLQCTYTHMSPYGTKLALNTTLGHTICQQSTYAYCKHLHHTTHSLLPIHHAIRSGNLAAVELMVESVPVNAVTDKTNGPHTLGLVEMPDRCMGWSCVHYAVCIDQSDIAIRMINYLVSKGASVIEQDHNGHTPLHYAVMRSISSIVMCLLNAAAQLKKPVGTVTPTKLNPDLINDSAVNNRHIQYISIQDKLGNTALHYSVASTMQSITVSDEQLKCVLFMLRVKGALPIAVTNEHNMTANQYFTTINFKKQSMAYSHVQVVDTKNRDRLSIVLHSYKAALNNTVKHNFDSKMALRDTGIYSIRIGKNGNDVAYIYMEQQHLIHQDIANGMYLL